MYNVKSLGRYFSFYSHLIRRGHSCLISFRLFDGIFPERLTQPIAARLDIMKITMNEATE